MSNHLLPADFWSEFRTRYWEKSPGVFTNLFVRPFVTHERLFEAIVGMPSRMPADRFWASRQIPPRTRDDYQSVQLDQHGPRRQDLSLDGFFARVRQQIGDLPVGLNIHNLEKAQPELWFRFREFVHPLNRITGELPSGRWDIDTFLGTYRTTPLGIHRDNASVFAFGVMGHRTYFTWPGDYFKPGDAALSTLDPGKIQPHLDRAIRLELGPGDLVYWPSSNWHFVTSDGQPSAVISISAYFGQKLSEIVGNQIRNLIAGQLKHNDFNRKYTLDEEQTDLPRQLVTALDLVENTVNNGQVSRALQRLWLTFCSSDGLHPVPPDSNATLDMQGTVSVDPRFPIIWRNTGHNELMIAVNGHTFSSSTAGHAVIIEMLKRLNSGQLISVEQLIDEYARSEFTPIAIGNLLNSLQNFRAFR